MGLSEKKLLKGLSYEDFLSFEAQLKDSLKRELMSILMIKKEMEYVEEIKKKLPKPKKKKNILVP